METHNEDDKTAEIQIIRESSQIAARPSGESARAFERTRLHLRDGQLLMGIKVVTPSSRETRTNFHINMPGVCWNFGILRINEPLDSSNVNSLDYDFFVLLPIRVSVFHVDNRKTNA